MKHIISWILTLALLLTCVPAVSVPVSAEEDSLKQMEITVDVDLASNDELFAVYVQSVLYGIDYSTYGITAGQRLTGDDKVLYDALVPVIKDIAAGKRSATVIGVGELISSSYPVDVETTFTSGAFPNFEKVFDALLTDLPYELYWFDKTASSPCLGYPGSYVQLSLSVAKNYGTAQQFTVDTSKAGAAATAAANARSVVDSLASKSDYEKLVGYRDAICNLVSYNHAAADTNNFTQNDDPWQLIYVFDGDSTTNVVCEGYSKAFMYLCDLTDFNGDVTCCTVYGAMNGGSHMWNIVTLEGENYLVDVTNSDEGTIGYNGGFFLAGATGNPSAGYMLHAILYTYDSRMLNLWGSGADSILTLAVEDYTPGTPSNPDDETSRLLGDVTGDGKVTATDYSRLLAHVKKVNPITDTDSLWAADVTGDGKITATDYSRLLAHVKKVNPLW